MVISKENFPAGNPINIKNLNVCQGVSLTHLQYLLNVKYLIEIENQSPTEVKIEKRKLDLHMEEDDNDNENENDTLEGDRSNNKFDEEISSSDMGCSRTESSDEIDMSNVSIESIITLIKKQTIETLTPSMEDQQEDNSFEKMLSHNPILQLARKVFYEGQVRVTTLQ